MARTKRKAKSVAKKKPIPKKKRAVKAVKMDVRKSGPASSHPPRPAIEKKVAKSRSFSKSVVGQTSGTTFQTEAGVLSITVPSTELDLKARRAQLIREIVRKKREDDGNRTGYVEESDDDVLFGEEAPVRRRVEIEDEEDDDDVSYGERDMKLFDDPDDETDEESDEKDRRDGDVARPTKSARSRSELNSRSLPQHEKRKDIRVPVEMPVDCRCNENFLFEYSMNLSQNGIFIKTGNPLPPGTELCLSFSLPNSSEKIKVKGEVIWVNNKKDDSDSERTVGMGIRFLNIKSDDRKQIMSLVKRIAIL